jgi:hypothetical protein
MNPQHQIPNNIQSRSNISNDSLMKAYGVRSSRARLHRSNDTRWNSVYNEINVALDLQGAFDEFIISEKENTLRSSGNEDAYGIRDAVVTDALSSDD